MGQSEIDVAIEQASVVLTFDDFANPLHQLGRALAAHGALLFSYEQGLAPVFRGGSLAPTMVEYREAHLLEDPIHGWMRALSPRVAVSTDDPWFERGQFRDSLGYRDFYRHAGFEHMLGAWLTDQRYGEPGMVGVLLVRDRPFAPEASAALRAVRAPLSQALRRARRLETMQAGLSAVEHLLERGARGVDVVWDRTGRLLWLSRRGREVFEGQGAPQHLVEAAARFREDVLRRRRSLEPRVSRTGIDGVIASLFAIPDAPSGPWVCATLEAGPDRPPLEPLTSAELRVLRAVAAGESNGQIAEQLGVSLETVRTHAKRVYRKLGVRNRTQASLRARDLNLVTSED